MNSWRKWPLNQKLRLLKSLQEQSGGGAAAPVLNMAPHPRQAEFLALACEEALFGGSAGGGKTEALLMWLAAGVNIPGYSAIAFRRTYPQLSKADGLIAKSRQMYAPLGAVFREMTKSWTFPSGATIELGHLQYDKDVENYQGAAYDRIAFDELTQFSQYQYTYLFSRLGRVSKGIKPGVRAASNPGGLGHTWVKSRFITKEAMEAIRGWQLSQPSSGVFWAAPDRAFVPARVADNPALNVDDYVRRLSTYLDPLTKSRLLNGDWSVVSEGRIKEAWIRSYRVRGDHYLFEVGGQFQAVDARKCTRFVIVDCAATSEEVARQAGQKPPSFSVAMVFDADGGRICVHEVRRGLWDFPELLRVVQEVNVLHQPAWIGIEDEKTGRALIQVLRRSSLNIRPLATGGKDKLTRAAEFLNRCEQGGFYLPDAAIGKAWRDDLLNELLLWTGHPDETADQIDACAYACREWQRDGVGEVIRLDGGIVGAPIGGGSAIQSGGRW